MALQVSNYTVVDNNRQLTNITGIDATTAAAIGAAGVGGSLPTWNPSSTPDVTYSTTSVWTKPSSLGSSDWVVFYLIGGGGGGNYGNWAVGGNGASANIFAALAGSLPSSITFYCGAGGTAAGNTGPGTNGGDTFATINGRLYLAPGGATPVDQSTSTYSNGVNNTPQPLGSYTVPYDGTNPYDYTSNDVTGGLGSAGPPGSSYTTNAQWASQVHGVFGGGGGTGAVLSGTTSTVTSLSTFAGGGGRQNRGTINNGNGQYPGGGGGGTYSGPTSGGNGGAGNVRIWYV